MASINSALSSAKILVIGAAGSIGGAFVRELADLACGTIGALHLVDIAENNLAEVVRDLRARGLHLPDDFQTFSLDFAGLEMKALLGTKNYDYVLNFSALKHVRAERDPYTLMRMLMTNVVANDALIDWLEVAKPQRLFAVSSDKAVRPASLMGASKAFMERVLLSRADAIPVTSARFANVAYSDGSLLHGFNERIAKRQPISAPSDVRRYFISHQEAAQLCILAAFACKNKEIVYPKGFAERDALSFAEIAILHLQSRGYEPMEFKNPADAIDFMRREPLSSLRWACHFASSDTSGEKLIEEFVGADERIDDERFKAIGVVTHPREAAKSSLDDAINDLVCLRESLSWTKEELVRIVSRVVPELSHCETASNLDQKL
jgi:nucleoside-diphosphate-sugar epimerase